MPYSLESHGFLLGRQVEIVLGVRSKPIRTVMLWQTYATCALMLVAGLLGGIHASASVLLGGLVSVLAGWIYAVVGSLGGAGRSAGDALLSVLRAEAAKVLAVVAGLTVVFVAYRELVVLAFLGTFVTTTLIFAMAILVREQ